jgi:CTP:molybdopterin cytidylyltransferase MocA
MAEPRLAAVILAAGAGRRMGGVAKALLPSRDVVGHTAAVAAPAAVRSQTFLSRIIATARSVGVVDAVVVVGPPFGVEVAGHAEALGLRVIENPAPERGMASSIALGFDALAASDADAAWLWPVDHPGVSVATLRALVDALAGHDAARPVVAGRGGHPPLVARAVWPRLVACATTDGGARAVLAAVDRVDVLVDDRACVDDVDTVRELELAGAGR